MNQYVHVSPVLESPNLDTAFQVCHTVSHRAEQTGEVTSLALLPTLFPLQLRGLLAILATMAHCWFTIRLLHTRTLKSFSAKLFPRQCVPHV